MKVHLKTNQSVAIAGSLVWAEFLVCSAYWLKSVEEEGIVQWECADFYGLGKI